MKKMFAMMMAATMALSLTACGGSGQTETAATTAAATEAEEKVETETETETETEGEAAGGSAEGEAVDSETVGNILEGKTVGFAQTDSMSAWRTTETDDIKKAVEAAGGEFIVKDAGGDIATQESDIRDLVAAGVDFLIAAPLEDNGLQGALEEAMENDIPVILVDRGIDGEAGTHYTTAIASDFIWEGEQCGKILKEALPEGGNVVIINGGYDSSTSTDRQKGFVDVLDDKYVIVAEQDGEWLMDKAQSVMENIIQAQGGENIDAVFCVTDDMVQGAMSAIDAAGLTPGEDILTIGIDGSRAAFEAVEEGRQLASCTCSPYFGNIVVDTISRIINGEELPPSIVNEDTLYTKDNVVVELGY